MSLIITDLTILCNPKIRLLGSFQSALSHFTHTFEEGKIYHLDSDFGEGGWALTYLLSGEERIELNGFFGEQKIVFNNIELIKSKQFREITCYVGQPDYDYYKAKNSFFWHLNRNKFLISELIKNSPVIKSKEYSFEEFCEKFNIEDVNDKNGRANRLLDQMSGTIWRYSIAIGIAYNKKIFCFPQMPKTFMNLISEDTIGWLYEELRRRNCIVLIPTKYPEYIKNIVSESVKLNLTTAST